MKLLTETKARFISVAILLLRCMVGIIFFVAGAGKVFGWFGGMGMQATLDVFKTQTHISTAWTYIHCYVELAGGLLLIIGLLTRPAAFLLVINMLVATVIMGTRNFFMGGAAYPFSLMVSSLAILLTGPMAYSIDAYLSNKKGTSLQPSESVLYGRSF
ncbi:MAG: DoxX family protein [Flavisolibacter sp.]|jgi:putative oxidoreductase